jgi:hypothetical protein
MFKISLNLLIYPFFKLSFSFLCSMFWFSYTPKYLYAFIESNYLISISIVFPVYCFLWSSPLFKQILSHFSNKNLILCHC